MTTEEREGFRRAKEEDFWQCKRLTSSVHSSDQSSERRDTVPLSDTDLRFKRTEEVSFESEGRKEDSGDSRRRYRRE